MSDLNFPYFAQLAPDRPAVIDPDGRCTSRAELFAQSNRLARALLDAGLSSGDSVAIMAPNCVEYLQVYFAAIQIGLYLVPINWHLAPPEIAYILRDSGAKAVVAHARVTLTLQATLQHCEAPPHLLLSIGRTNGAPDITDFSMSHGASAVTSDTRGRVLTYTSATTGRPKGVELPLSDAAGALARTIAVLNSCGILPESSNVHLCSSTLYHAGPLDWAVLALHMGHTLVLMDRWDPKTFLQLIEAHRVTTTLMAPAMFVRLTKLADDVRHCYSTATLRYVAHSSAPCPVEIKRQMIDWWGPILWESYGSSEGGGTIVDSFDWLKYPGTVGRPIAGTKLCILDDDSHEVPCGVVGTVYMTRYTGDRFQYRGDPEKTRAAYRGDYFSVGDLGYLNEAGYLFLCDRKVDVIISGGMNIYPAELERVLLQHSAIMDCAVFGIPDELMGEAPKAVIQLRAQLTPSPSLTTDIMNFLCARLSAAKAPRIFEYADSLPRDPNGKLFKRRLRELHGSAPFRGP